MNSGLPGWAVDLIRYGPSPGDLRRHGHGAIRSALIRTAMSAQRRGMDKEVWMDHLTAPTSRLGFLMRSRDGKALTASALGKLIDGIWDKAWLQISEDAVWSAEQTAIEAARRAKWVRSIADDMTNGLRDSDRRILHHAADVSDKHGAINVALPRRSIAAHTGLGVQAVRLSLARLEVAALLPCVEHGLPRGEKAKSKEQGGRPLANVYRLPEEGALYETGVPPVVGSSALVVGSSPAKVNKPDAGSSQEGAPVVGSSAGQPMGSGPVHFTVTAEQAALLRRLAAEAGLDIDALPEENR